MDPSSRSRSFAARTPYSHHYQAWLRVIGRLKPGASPDALPGRLTSLLRGWLVDESGMPADWMSGIKAELPKQVIKLVPAGAGVGVMRENYRREPAHTGRRLLPGAADCLREHR